MKKFVPLAMLLLLVGCEKPFPEMAVNIKQKLLALGWNNVACEQRHEWSGVCITGNHDEFFFLMYKAASAGGLWCHVHPIGSNHEAIISGSHDAEPPLYIAYNLDTDKPVWDDKPNSDLTDSQRQTIQNLCLELAQVYKECR